MGTMKSEYLFLYKKKSNNFLYKIRIILRRRYFEISWMSLIEIITEAPLLNSIGERHILNSL